ncbi:TetR family transcriptional regulator [Altererythrobacter sp. CC-YST694]|uniref:TetR family transcriptional regulator n=1 Tax=Altererythrobacter sp. CC-YST694 TaxID=2755038 RepID=UPI001D008373|nr:TetR family transcriptional regulator [Altererythrobacter sp. CC-YST694]MCB5424020.1 TetR family transcriptional regulator [Altererythrobacter sp. CC-YST694]
MSTRKRLTPEESRLAALEAARAQLIEAGPQSVTLKAVAARIGRTHANLLHHFGSAAGLQRALGGYLAETVCQTIADAVRATRSGEGSPRDVVDLTFDAFDSGGAGALASWMLASGNEDALDPVIETIHALVDELTPVEGTRKDEAEAVRQTTLTLVLLALGDALMGERMSASLGLPRGTARAHAEVMLMAQLAGQPS